MALIKFSSGFTNSNYEVTNNVLKKKGLILIEGTQTDSKGRKHTFSADRLHDIVFNTNELISTGARIPLLEDHQKLQDKVVGDLTGTLRAEVITEDNLPDARFKSLIGKVGIFVDEMSIKSQRAIQQAKEGLLSTISSGLDPITNIIREVSFTPTPAINGCVTFKSANFSDGKTHALTFDELRSSKKELSEIEEEATALWNDLWEITTNIQTAEDSTFESYGADANELQMLALEQFNEAFLELIGMNAEEEELEKSVDPRTNQQGLNPNAGYSGKFNREEFTPIAAFSLAEFEQHFSNGESSIAEFGYRKAITGTLKALSNRKQTGQTLGQIGSKFGRKIGNATRGKIAGVGRLGVLVKRAFTGTGSTGTKLSTGQQRRASTNINNAGGRQFTKTGKFTPSSNINTRRKQVRTKNTYVQNSPL